MVTKEGEVAPPIKKTLQMRARDSLYRRYRSRGKKNSNLWVVYSPKAQQDIILNSDLELIYWLHFIESVPQVTSFAVCDVGAPEDPDFLLNFIDGQHRADYLIRSPDKAGNNGLVIYDNAQWSTKYIDVKELAAVSRQALRWLKPIAFAAAIRDKELTPLHNALVLEESKCKDGTVKYLLDQLSFYDPNYVIGMLMRHFIKGWVSFDLADAPFGRNTIWTISECQYAKN